MTMLYNPNLKVLCAQIRALRENILRRSATIGCEVDEASFPKAETIVDAKIGEFLSSGEYHDIVERHGNDPAMRLLVLQCATAIHAAIPNKPARRATRGFWRTRRPDLRVVPSM